MRPGQHLDWLGRRAPRRTHHVPEWVRSMRPGLLRTVLASFFLPLGREAKRL